MDAQVGDMALASPLGTHAARNSLEQLIRDVVLRGERGSLVAAISAIIRLMRRTAVSVI